VRNSYRPAVRTAAAGLALTTYVLISHYASSLSAEEGNRSAAIALIPYLAVAAVLAWRSRYRYAWLLLCVAFGALTWRYLDAIGDHAVWVYFVQHAGGNASMAFVFGRSLIGQSEPICCRIAATMHGPLQPRHARYTRQVTLAWATFFVLNVGISVVLFAYAPVAVWSVFANLLAVPLVALMFAVEYVVRLRQLPDIKHGTILDGIRLYCRGKRAPTPSASV
jgi:uncharacterized membrane protein